MQFRCWKIYSDLHLFYGQYFHILPLLFQINVFFLGTTTSCHVVCLWNVMMQIFELLTLQCQADLLHWIFAWVCVFGPNAILNRVNYWKLVFYHKAEVVLKRTISHIYKFRIFQILLNVLYIWWWKMPLFFCMLILANRHIFTCLFFKVTLFSFAQQPIVMISAKKSLGTTYLWFCSSIVMKKKIFIFPFLCTFWAKYVAKYG